MKRLILSCSIILLVLIGCYTVPETGRVALNLSSAFGGYLDQQAGLAFKALKKKEKISTDAEVNNRVKTIGRRIVNAIGNRPGMPPAGNWEFVVFDAPDKINAFAMPGGKVAVYTGLFKAIETDEELAFVMGHEIAHVLAKHGGERMTQALAVMGVGVGVNQIFSEKSERTRKMIMTAYGLGAQFGYILRYSRSHESEADQIGMLYMARAGYDPAGALDVWNKMNRASGGKAPPEWLSTHPAHSTRTAQMKGYLPYASAEYRRAIKGK